MASYGQYLFHTLTNMFSDSSISDNSKDVNAPHPRDEDSPGGYYHPSTKDVMVVKDLLLRLPKRDLLPLELIDTIIDNAEYWPRTISRRSKAVKVSGSPRRQGQEESIFVLRTLPIGYSEEGDFRDDAYFTTKPQPWQESMEGLPNVTESLFENWQRQYRSRGKNICRKIVFNVESHDQGWGGEHGTQKTYKNSWTWVDVGVETLRAYEGPTLPTDSQAQQSNHDGIKDDVAFNPLRFRKFDIEAPQANIINSLRTIIPATVITPSTSTMHIPHRNQPFSFHHPLLPSSLCLQKNLVSERTPQSNVITWRCTDNVHEDSQEGDELDAKGRGSRTLDGEFVRGLQAGDCVTIWAKARFPGWTNVVENVSVEVFWAV